jgi:hypothetical protein
MLDAIKKDNPELSEEEAEDKLRSLLEEKLLKASEAMRNVVMEENQEEVMEEDGEE